MALSSVISVILVGLLSRPIETINKSLREFAAQLSRCNDAILYVLATRFDNLFAFFFRSFFFLLKYKINVAKRWKETILNCLCDRYVTALNTFLSRFFFCEQRKQQSNWFFFNFSGGFKFVALFTHERNESFVKGSQERHLLIL